MEDNELLFVSDFERPKGSSKRVLPRPWQISWRTSKIILVESSDDGIPGRAMTVLLFKQTFKNQTAVIVTNEQYF